MTALKALAALVNAHDEQQLTSEEWDNARAVLRGAHSRPTAAPARVAPIYGDDRVDYEGWTLHWLNDEPDGRARFYLGKNGPQIFFTAWLDHAVEVLKAFADRDTARDNWDLFKRATGVKFDSETKR